jgi:hypothetical protein
MLILLLVEFLAICLAFWGKGILVEGILGRDRQVYLLGLAAFLVGVVVSIGAVGFILGSTALP